MILYKATFCRDGIINTASSRLKTWVIKGFGTHVNITSFSQHKTLIVDYSERLNFLTLRMVVFVSYSPPSR